MRMSIVNRSKTRLRPPLTDATVPPDFREDFVNMKRTTATALLVVFTLGLFSANAGELTGTITLKGTPPKEKDITPLKDDPNCGKFHSAMPTTKFYVVGAGGELADAVVYLTGITGKSTGGSAAPTVLDQKSCEYVPQIFAVQTGQKLN